ncbi:DeoR family transcriptional regulator [Microlunatus endophyticus]|uniref:DeoR family transcriptional regulator n=1 Tax=Microlunatus endophyticus TaxID=1716077 RepID=A0A917SAU2_9ACTN|nr:DeoR family transcriptional regulator [Microlunatus endophyticus]
MAFVTDWRTDRVASALDGTNPTVVRHLDAGFAVAGDVQFLPGYSLLLTDQPGTDRLTDLPRNRRLAFLGSMEMLGEAVEIVCRRLDPAFRRINLEIQGNLLPLLHAHIWPRYDWEPDHLVMGPVALYPDSHWRDPDTRLGPSHDRFRVELGEELDRLRSNSA